SRAGGLGFGPVGVVVGVAVAAVGDDQPEQAGAGDVDVQGLRGIAALDQTRVGDQLGVGPDLEGDRAGAGLLVVEADGAVHRRAVAAEVVGDGAGSVGAEALRVGDAAELDRVPVAGLGLAVAGVAFHRPVAVVGGQPRIVAELGGAGGERGGDRH